jgi:alkylhydroperoxidase family enzyme
MRHNGINEQASCTNKSSIASQTPRIPYPAPSEFYPSLQKLLKQVPLNGTRMLGLASEGVFDGFGAFGRAVNTGTQLDPALREVVMLRVGYLSGASYVLQQHEATARTLDITDEQITAIRQGGPQPEILSKQQQAVVDFTDDVVKNVRASDKTLSVVRQFLSDRTVADLVFLIGCYMTISRYMETMGVPLEPNL